MDEIGESYDLSAHTRIRRGLALDSSKYGLPAHRDLELRDGSCAESAESVGA
jgi:hypothetical protein